MPAVELADTSAAEARQALAHLGDGRVPGTIPEDLLIGVTEAVSNALLHRRSRWHAGGDWRSRGRRFKSGRPDWFFEHSYP